ncbi:MAG: NAD(P)H-dependent oxidoreductase [Deltaproteobacteria bacterium]|jgi:multimeric flavodoxin WrbA|nr:NAD(P)H-dependent oxidoreductase [Deltaproteobacteria bacterium]
MSNKKIVILDGTGTGDDYLAAPFSVLTDLLDYDNADVKCYHLKEIKLAHCDGCFGCWIKTPGICVKSDEQREIIQTIIRSDMIILFTPVTFGGYSSVLKIIVDRFIPLILPFFGKYYGEIHHSPRYTSYPRLVGIGVQRNFEKAEADLFKALVGRNAINFHAPSFAADVFSSEEDNETLNKRLKSVISRLDPFPVEDDIVTFFPKADMTPFDNKQKGARNALLIVGSPKMKHRSTSGILGEYLTEILKTSGWKTEVLKLKGSLRREKGQVELCSAVDRSDLIILAFPLYIDALPYLVTKAFEVIARHNKTLRVKKPQSVYTIINNGFPEFHQNALALAICRFFADQCGISWAGALAMGAGEAIGGGQELTKTKRSGPPVKHVIEALDKAGADLDKGSAVSLNVQSLISKTPIPIVPFGIWRWIFTKLGGKGWKRQALENGVKKEEMYAKPYAD